MWRTVGAGQHNLTDLRGRHRQERVGNGVALAAQSLGVGVPVLAGLPFEDVPHARLTSTCKVSVANR